MKIASPQSKGLRTRTLCVRRGLGRSLNKPEKTPVPHQRFGCFCVCGYKGIACQYGFVYTQTLLASLFSLQQSPYWYNNLYEKRIARKKVRSFFLKELNLIRIFIFLFLWNGRFFSGWLSLGRVFLFTFFPLVREILIYNFAFLFGRY